MKASVFPLIIVKSLLVLVCRFCPEMTLSIPHQGVTVQTKSLHMEPMPSSLNRCLFMLIVPPRKHPI